MTAEPFLSVRGLSTDFALGGGWLRPLRILHAVSDVGFDLAEGETLGVVGESGCGKSTLGRSLLRLIEPTSGSIKLDGREITSLDRGDMRELRRDLQIIFQDPIASLDPRMTVGNIIAEPLTVYEPHLSRTDRDDRVREVMAQVGLAPEMINRYPHEFSGGQAQRIGIARAVIQQPRIIVCDEPVSALDVSIQAQIINLLIDLKNSLKLTLVFISHDLSVVRHISDRVLVLYLGRQVEAGPTEQVFAHPRHPYTQALLASALIPDPRIARDRDFQALEGEVPSPISPPSGCAFRTRCPLADDLCAAERPATRDLDGQQVACHHADGVPATPA